jgi:hypothetical protein
MTSEYDFRAFIRHTFSILEWLDALGQYRERRFTLRRRSLPSQYVLTRTLKRWHMHCSNLNYERQRGHN